MSDLNIAYTIKSLTNPVRLTKKQGDYIKAYIWMKTGMNQTEFAQSINMNDSLLSRYLSGKNVITKQALDKILSAIGDLAKPPITVKAQWQTHIVIQEITTGQDAQIVDYTPTEETS